MVIGIAGKSCSGKNLAAQILQEEAGFFQADADKIGHRILEARADEVARALGVKLPRTENGLDRRELASAVFNSPEKLKRLEEMLYPGIEAQIIRLNREHPNLSINAVKLFESGLFSLCDAVFWVQSPARTRLKRALKRDHRPAAEIKQRFRAQKQLSPQPWKKSVDIYKVNNQGSPDQLKKGILKALKQIS